MDPNENIKRQRELAAEIVALNGSVEVRETGRPTRALWDYAPELAELVQALDEWRRSGGFDPYLLQSPHLSERGLHDPPIGLAAMKERLDAAAYQAICDVVDRVKCDERSLDTDQYAGMILDALVAEADAR